MRAWLYAMMHEIGVGASQKKNFGKNPRMCDGIGGSQTFIYIESKKIA